MSQRPSERAKARRINWSLLAAVCVGLGLVVSGAFALGMFVVGGTSPGPLEQVLHAVAQPVAQSVDIRSSAVDAVYPTPPAEPAITAQTRVRSLLPEAQLDPEAQVAPESQMAAQVPRVNAAGQGSQSARTPGATTLAAGVAPTTSPTSDVRTLGATNAGDISAMAVATATTGQTEDTEPPPAAEMGMTYCGMVTCNVGLKCCCSQCVPADQECGSAECEAYSGLSVSVPCGMDLCDSGEICCDPRCGACARAGECPEEPCG